MSGFAYFSSINSSKSLCKCSYQFMFPAGSVPGKQILVPIWSCLFIQISGWEFALLTQFTNESRTVVDFQMIHLFLVVMTALCTLELKPEVSNCSSSFLIETKRMHSPNLCAAHSTLKTDWCAVIPHLAKQLQLGLPTG